MYFNFWTGLLCWWTQSAERLPFRQAHFQFSDICYSSFFSCSVSVSVPFPVLVPRSVPVPVPLLLFMFCTYYWSCLFPVPVLVPLSFTVPLTFPFPAPIHVPVPDSFNSFVSCYTPISWSCSCFCSVHDYERFLMLFPVRFLFLVLFSIPVPIPLSFPIPVPVPVPQKKRPTLLTNPPCPFGSKEKKSPLHSPHKLAWIYECLVHMLSGTIQRQLYIKLNLSFLWLPESHICHQGLDWPCIIVGFFIYQQLIMTLDQTRGFRADFKTHFFIRVTIYPAVLPYNISRSHPTRVTALF